MRHGIQPREPCQHGSEKGLQIFSSWSQPRGVAVFGTPDYVDTKLVTSPEVKEETRWECAIWAWESIRVGNNLTALHSSVIQETGNHYTKYKARVRFGRASGGSIREFDIAQGVRFSLVGCLITIDVMYPDGGVLAPLLPKQDDALATMSGQVLDTMVGASIKPAYGTPGSQILTNTHTERIGAGDANALIPIPPGTRWISMYQTRPGAVIDPSFLDYNAAAANNIGAIILGADRRVERLARPGQAGAIDLGPADQNNNRWVTIVFELEM
jgi:hypothetical protein